MKTFKDSDVKHFKQKLLQRKKELKKLMEESYHEEKPIDIDESQVGLLSRLEAIDEKAVHEEIDHKREQELQRIDLALGRMDKGEYGFCMVCGEDIDTKRLELDPSVLACIDCAKDYPINFISWSHFQNKPTAGIFCVKRGKKRESVEDILCITFNLI